MIAFAGDGAILSVLSPDGNYNATNWETGDLITKPRMNKLEGGVYKNRADINKILKTKEE